MRPGLETWGADAQFSTPAAPVIPHRGNNSLGKEKFIWAETNSRGHQVALLVKSTFFFKKKKKGLPCCMFLFEKTPTLTTEEELCVA